MSTSDGRQSQSATEDLRPGVTAGTPDRARVPRAPAWYRRRGVLVAGAVVVIAAVAAVTDLPQHTTRSQEIAGDTTVMSEVNADVAPCSYAVGEALGIFADLEAHSLTASETSQVPGLLHDDATACSFASDSIYQLSTIEVPGSAEGKHLGNLVSTVTLWATSEGLSAIEQVQTLSSAPGNTAARSTLAADEKLLGRDRAQALTQLAAADQLVKARLPALQLYRVSSRAATNR